MFRLFCETCHIHGVEKNRRETKEGDSWRGKKKTEYDIAKTIASAIPIYLYHYQKLKCS